MAKYQEFLSRVGSNRDRAALRGIFSMFLTDDNPPKLKALELAPIIFSGAETTQITISGASTTGILQSGTSTTAYSITGAFTTGINIAADGVTAIAVTSAFGGTNIISLAGTGSNAGILISGACGKGISITGVCTNAISIAAAVGSGILIGGSSADPVLVPSTGTTNLVDINGKLTAASGTLRGLVSYVEFSGTHVDVATNVYAIRGYAKVGGSVGIGNVLYSAGVQGKLELSGTIAGGKHAAVLAQLNSSAGLTGATGGTVYCLWADGMQVSQTPAAGINMTAIGIELPDAATRFDSAIYIYGGATYLLDIAGEGVGGSYAATWNQSPGAATGSLKIRVGSTDVYLLCTTDPTA